MRVNWTSLVVPCVACVIIALALIFTGPVHLGPAGKCAPLCPAIGAVVKPEGTPEQVCGKVPRCDSERLMQDNCNDIASDRDPVLRCWSVVTTAWARYYQCGGTRPAPKGGGSEGYYE